MKRSILIAGIAGLAMWLTSCSEDQEPEIVMWPDQEQSGFTGTYTTTSVTFVDEVRGINAEYTQACERQEESPATSLNYLVSQASHFDSINIVYENKLNIIRTNSCKYPAGEYLLVPGDGDDDYDGLYPFWQDPASKANGPNMKTRIVGMTDSSITLQIFSGPLDYREDIYALVTLSKVN